MIQVGDKLPAGTLNEFIEVEGNGCSIGPNSFDIAKETAGNFERGVAVAGREGDELERSGADRLLGDGLGRREDLARRDQMRRAAPSVRDPHLLAQRCR